MIKLTPEERKKALENPEFFYVNINHVWTDTRDKKEESMLSGGFVLDWAAKHIGFGQIRFRQKGTDLKKLELECESEHMGKDFVEKALAHFLKNTKIVE